MHFKVAPRAHSECPYHKGMVSMGGGAHLDSTGLITALGIVYGDITLCPINICPHGWPLLNWRFHICGLSEPRVTNIWRNKNSVCSEHPITESFLSVLEDFQSSWKKELEDVLNLVQKILMSLQFFFIIAILHELSEDPVYLRIKKKAK